MIVCNSVMQMLMSVLVAAAIAMRMLTVSILRGVTHVSADQATREEDWTVKVTDLYCNIVQ